MGFFNPIAYFIRQFFRYLRSITGKLFIIFVLLFCVLILYLCIDKGVFAVSNYTQLSYIESSGTQYIDTGIKNSRNLIVELECSVNYSNSQQCMFGAYGFSLNNSGYTDDRLALFTGQNGDTDKLQFAYGYSSPISWTTSISGLDTTLKNKYTFGNGSFYINDELYTTYNLYNFKVDNCQNCVVFGVRYTYGEVKFLSSMKLYSLKLTENNVLLRDFIPVKDSNNVVCLYDKVSNTFFYNNGTGSFSTGAPFIENESSTINNWSFDYLHINSGSETIYYDNVLGEQTTASLYLDYIYNDIRYRYQIPQNLYAYAPDGTFNIYIPRTSLLNNVNITNGSNVSFYLGVRKNTEDIFPLGDYTFTLTTAEEEQIQQDSDKALQGEILGAQQETNNKLDNLDNSINDDKVDDMSSDFGSLGDGMTAEDNTGIDTIFQKLYDAFCNNEIQPVSLTIPFVNKSFTIDSNSVSSNFPPAVKSIVAVFVWGVIGLWVLKDIRSIIDKISEGSPEDVGSDVKKEVL